MTTAIKEAPSVPSKEHHLEVTERLRIINRLREFGTQQEESEQLSDRGSLDRARDLMTLYYDKGWVDEMPAPGRRSRVEPDDFSRFVKWATEDERLGLQRKQVSRLKRTAAVDAVLAPTAPNLHGASGRALLPLNWLVTNDYATSIGEVWRDAVQLSDTGTPTETNVRRALSDWKKRNLPKPDKPGSDAPKANARQKAIRYRDEGIMLLRTHPELFGEVLDALNAAAEEYLAEPVTAE